MKQEVIIYTDGSSRGNPGLGGWAAILIAGDTVVELGAGVLRATNNQMELEAVIHGLEYAVAHFPKHVVHLHADSTYVLKGIESWLDGWKRNNWQTSQKKPVENRDLWETLLVLRDLVKQNSGLVLVKVKGHAGEDLNERCDTLAVQFALSEHTELYKGSLDEYKKLVSMAPKKSSSPSKSSSKAAYSYVSLVGGKVYVDKDWSTCEKRVKGHTAKYKKVFSKEEETDLIQDYTLDSLL